MTCIVGIEKKGTVWLGGDSAGTARNMHQRVRADKKVFIKGEFIMGFCGSFRMGQLLQCSLVIPERQSAGDDYSWLVTEFTAAVKKCLAAEGGEGEEKLTPNFLFGYKGKLYGMMGDYQVSKPEFGFDAMGSGADIAIGAMHASKGKWNPKKRILQALEASAHNNAAVRPPFHVLSLKNGDHA